VRTLPTFFSAWFKQIKKMADVVVPYEMKQKEITLIAGRLMLCPERELFFQREPEIYLFFIIF
jgi:hypothetical protein